VNISSETKVGTLAAVSITILILGYNFLKGNQIFSSQDNLYAIYENVQGLNASDPVLVNGLKIGSVKSLLFTDKNSGKIVVELVIINDIHIPRNSIARIISPDLLGAKAISIILGDEQKLVEDGDTLISEIQGSLKDEVAKQILPVKVKAEDLLSKIDSILTPIQYLLTDESNKFHKSFSNLEKAIENFGAISAELRNLVADQSEKISEIMSNAQSITTNFKNNNELLSNIMSNISKITDSLAASNILSTVNGAQKSLDELAEVLHKINSGEGTMGLLLNDKRLYDHLEASAKDMDELLIDLKENPQRYIRLSVISFGSGKRKKEKEKEKKTEEQ